MRPKYQKILRLKHQQVSNDIETKLPTLSNIKLYLDQDINKYQKMNIPKNQQVSNDIETKEINKYQMILKPKHQEI